jgi:hypothetical protein
MGSSMARTRDVPMAAVLKGFRFLVSHSNGNS